MADANLVEFVKAALERGESKERISKALKTAGWPEDQVASALGAFADVEFPVPVPRPRVYGSAREAFLYIVYFSLLGMVATQVGSLAFAFVDRLFTDELSERAAYYTYAATALRWSVASLLVGFPIFLHLGWRLAAKKRRDPERRRSRVNAWLTYVTLIFAAGALIGDLVAVVYQFLSGELGARFAAKAAIVGSISAAILWNYSRDVERQTSGADFAGRALAIATSLVVAALVVWAFTVVRSPQSARMRLADEKRIEDLGVIARLVDCHYTYIGSLPPSLDRLSATMTGLAARQPVAGGCAEPLPVDPTSGADYAYRVVDADSFDLCAAFERAWPDVETEKERQHLLTTYGEITLYGPERRTLRKPPTPGEACFEIDAVKFETAAELRIEDVSPKDIPTLGEEVEE